MANLFRSFVDRLSRIVLPPDHCNVEFNRAVWDKYAKYWAKPIIHMLHPHTKGNDLQCLGDEWGNPKDVEKIIADYIYPFIDSESVVGEIGSGGGRIASKVADRAKEFYCFDISKEMLKRAKTALSIHNNVSYVLLERPRFPEELTAKFDFVYSFDVFVHLDLHMMWRYFNEIHKLLKPNGKAFIHTANLNAPGGWQRFSSQDEYSVAGHYFVSPEMIDILAQHSDLEVVKKSTIDPTNFYLNRDYLVILAKGPFRATL